MVGVPRSKGCSECVSRHLKCDEHRPTCLRCQKAGRSCPGYPLRLVFKNTTSGTTSAAQGKVAQTTKSTSTSPPMRNDTNAKPPRKRKNGQSTDANFLELVVAAPKIQPEPAVLLAPHLEQSQLMSALVEAFSPRGPDMTPSTLHTRKWLTYVYDCIGKTRTLDLAMRATDCLQTGLLKKDQRMVNVARVLYINTLQSLQVALVDDKSPKSELQSAVMLLTLYELMSNRKEDTWIKHSGGASEIMRVRGAKAYTSGFDMAIYAVCRNFVVIEAFVSSKACFLEDPEWESVCQARAKATGLDWEERMHLLFVKSPRIARDIQRAKLGQHDMQDVQNRACDLRRQLKLTFAEWWAKLEPHDLPIEISCDEEPFTTAYSFSGLLVPGMMCSYAATLIILDRILAAASSSDQLEELITEQHFQAEEICRCVIQASTKLMGSILMPFWLQIAAEGCAPEHKEWTLAKLQTFDVSERVLVEIKKASNDAQSSADSLKAKEEQQQQQQPLSATSSPIWALPRR